MSSDAPAHTGSVSLVMTAHQLMRGRATEPHPEAAAVEKAVLDFAERHRLVDGRSGKKLRAIGCGWFAGYTYAYAPVEQVTLGGCLIAWLYLYDDLHDEGRTAGDLGATTAEFDEMVALCREGGAPPQSPGFRSALLELRARAVARVGEGWTRRFAGSLGEYFRGCVEELPYRHAGARISLADYRDLRALTIGAYPVFDLIEAATGHAISDAWASEAEVGRARKLGSLLCAWVNDLHSFRKERGDDDPMNVVNILRHEQKLDLAGALMATAELFNRDLAELDRARAQLAASPALGPAERAYLAGLAAWVHGNYAWTPTSGRYYRPPSAEVSR
jgi:hypothetical protein